MQYDKDFLKKQKEALLAEKERIEKEIAKLKKYPDYGDDEEDNLQELNDFEGNLIIDDKIESILNKINKALKAIDAGTYGQCSKCKEAISEGRLKAMPWADICLACGKNKK